MPERARPDLPEFKDAWFWGRRVKGLLPWRVRKRSPHKQALMDRYEFCRPYVRGRRVLDVPCGAGWGTTLLRGAKLLVGVDIDPQALRDAKDLYGRRAHWVCGSMASLPFPRETFDALTCLEGIEHVSRQAGGRFFAEAARVLRPGGQMILTSPIPTAVPPANPYHVHEYEPAELRAALSAHFGIAEEQTRKQPEGEVSYWIAGRRE